MRARRWLIWALVMCGCAALVFVLILVMYKASDDALKTATKIGGVVFSATGIVAGVVSAVIAWLAWRRPRPPVTPGLSPGRPVEATTKAALPVAVPPSWERFAVVDHGALFGAESAKRDVGDWLANERGDWIISIFGPGGAGKTTIAYEAVKDHAEAAGFQRIAWVSAKFQHLGALGEVDDSDRLVNDWRDLLVSAAGQLQLGVDLVPALIELQFRDGLRRIDEKCLVIIDNLETVSDAKFAIDFLQRESLLRPHKVIVTTRESALPFARNVRELKWSGLTPAASRDFTNYLTHQAGIRLEDADLKGIVRVTGGNPLLIQLICRRMSFDGAPVGDVIAGLSDPNTELGSTVAHYLFAESLSALATRLSEPIAAQLMATFCCKAPGGSFGLDELFKLSGIADRDLFEKARGTACHLALLQSFDRNTRTTIHPLLRGFVCETI